MRHALSLLLCLALCSTLAGEASAHASALTGAGGLGGVLVSSGVPHLRRHAPAPSLPDRQGMEADAPTDGPHGFAFARTVQSVRQGAFSLTRGESREWDDLHDRTAGIRSGELGGGVGYYARYRVLDPADADEVWANPSSDPFIAFDAGFVADVSPRLSVRLGGTAALASTDGFVMPTVLLLVDLDGDTLTLGLPETSYRHTLTDALALRLCANMRSGYVPAPESPAVVPQAGNVLPGIAAAWLDWQVTPALSLTLGAEYFFTKGGPRLDGSGGDASPVSGAGAGGVFGVRLVF